MLLNQKLRKLALTLHIAVTVGWFGPIAAFLALAIFGYTSLNDQIVRSSYIGMGILTEYVIIPFSFASISSGIISSVGTNWGLFRHYWVVIKLVLTLAATGILLLHSKPIAYLASIAMENALKENDHTQLRLQLVVNAGAALVVLLITLILGVYKPKGLTKYGHRKIQKRSMGIAD